MEEFSDIALDHFMCPRNMGIIDSPNGEGNNGEPSCGDYIEIYVRIENKKHCSNLGVQALRNAVQDYYGKEKK